MVWRAAVLLSLTAAVANAQCNLSLIASAQFRASQLDASVNGFDLWTATSYGVSLYDRHFDPPLITASVAVPGTTKLVRAGSTVTYAGSGDKIAVIRRNGRSLQLVRLVDAGGTVNDLLLTTNYLYAATSNGLAQFDLLDAANPAKTAATFSTSSTNVLSLAQSGSALYAADGDSSVEVFSIAIPLLPQRIGQFAGRPRSTTIRAASARLFVSDGTQTDIFIGTDASVIKATTTPAAFGATTLAEPQANIVFTAGSDRRLRALDITLPASPVELFTSDLAGTSGSVNRINSVVSVPNRVYAAAGDIGLATYDSSGFTSPFALHSYVVEPLTSVVADGDNFYFSRSSGGVSRFAQKNGTLTEGTSLDRTRSDLVQDVNNFMLTSSGGTMTMWSISGSTPAAVATASYPKTVVSAILIGTTGYAALADKTLWTADFSQKEPVPQKMEIGVTPSFIVRSGGNVAIADLSDDGGVTRVYFFGSGFPQSTPVTATVSGLSTGGIALSGTTAAAATFTGVTLLDFAASGAQTTIPQSNGFIARKLALRGSRLVELTDTAALVWDTAAKKLLRKYELPADAVSADINGDGSVAGVATSSGATTILLNAASQQPVLMSTLNPNAYYKKVMAIPGHVFLQDSRGVDVFTNRLEYRGSARPAGFVDAAASEGTLFTITSDFRLSAYGSDGPLMNSTLLALSGDVRPLTLSAAGGAAWLAIERGCFTTGCETKTLIYNTTGTQTAEITGSLRELAVSGTRAYALFDTPNEIRVYDIGDPLHPHQLGARAAEGTRPAVAIAYANGTIYVLGDKLYAYAESDLSKTGEQFAAYVADPANPVTYVDQHVRVDGNCAATTGRTFSPQLFNVASPASWSAAASPSAPSPARSIASVPGTLYVLTDHSLEVLAAQPLPAPGRRRTAGR